MLRLLIKREETMNKQVPKPTTQINILKRYLHILALVQNKADTQNWNNQTLADILSREEDEEIITDSVMNRCTDEYIQGELGLLLTKKKGARRYTLQEPIKEELLNQLLNVYSAFVIKDIQKDLLLQSLAKQQPEVCLWLLARIHFAAIEMKVIEFSYTSNNAKKQKVVAHPYHIVLKNNNLYLAALREFDGNVCLFVLNRIRDLKVRDLIFRESIPDVSELFKYSIGSFISKKRPTEVTVKYRKELHNNFLDFLAGIETDIIEESAEDYTIHFSISDTMALCKQLFLYGEKVEIVKPSSVRKEMVDMLKKSLEVYGG